MKPRVVLVDDHALFRAGVRGELGDQVDIVGEAESVAEAVPLIKELDPDVVLLDVHLPDGGGEAVIAGVAQERPGVRFLALSVSDAAEDVIGVIRAGARGYVTKTISGDELADAVRRTADGDAVFSPRLAGFVLDAFRAGERVHSDAGLDELTPREREVLQLIARGYRYKEIAGRLHLSVKTIESHVSSVLRKLQLSSRHELTRWAAERRLIRGASSSWVLAGSCPGTDASCRSSASEPSASLRPCPPGKRDRPSTRTVIGSPSRYLRPERRPASAVPVEFSSKNSPRQLPRRQGKPSNTTPRSARTGRSRSGLVISAVQRLVPPGARAARPPGATQGRCRRRGTRSEPLRRSRESGLVCAATSGGSSGDRVFAGARRLLPAARGGRPGSGLAPDRRGEVEQYARLARPECPRFRGS